MLSSISTPTPSSTSTSSSSPPVPGYILNNTTKCMFPSHFNALLVHDLNTYLAPGIYTIRYRTTYHYIPIYKDRSYINIVSKCSLYFGTDSHSFTCSGPSIREVSTFDVSSVQLQRYHPKTQKHKTQKHKTFIMRRRTAARDLLGCVNRATKQKLYSA